MSTSKKHISFKLNPAYKFSTLGAQSINNSPKNKIQQMKESVAGIKTLGVAPMEMYLLKRKDGMWLIPANINEFPLEQGIYKVVNYAP